MQRANEQDREDTLLFFAAVGAMHSGEYVCDPFYSEDENTVQALLLHHKDAREPVIHLPVVAIPLNETDSVTLDIVHDIYAVALRENIDNVLRGIEQHKHNLQLCNIFSLKAIKRVLQSNKDLIAQREREHDEHVYTHALTREPTRPFSEVHSIFSAIHRRIQSRVNGIGFVAGATITLPPLPDVEPPDANSDTI